MEQYGKNFILGVLIGIVMFATCILIAHSGKEFVLFLSQSIVDNAIFCGMFIVVVLVTGIHC